MKLPIGLFFALAVFFFAGPGSFANEEAGAGQLTADQVNGTWKMAKDTFKVWMVSPGKLHVSADCIFEYQSPQGPMANLGQGEGTAVLQGNTAIFRPDGLAQEDGKITMVFEGGKLKITQEGDCGFGHRVRADGVYARISKKKPKFGE